MAIAISTIGIKVSYAFEENAGEGYSGLSFTKIPQVKEIPEMNPSPDTIEITSFDNLEYKTFIDGLKDLGGALDFTANYTQELYDLWQDTPDGIMAKWASAKGANKAMWLCIDIPGIDESCYLRVSPSALGLPPATTNTVMEITLHFTPVGEPVWDTDPTYAGTSTETVTFTGYVSNGVEISVFKNDTLVKKFETKASSTAIDFPAGDYSAVAKKSGKTTQIKDFTVASSAVTVTFSTFA